MVKDKNYVKKNRLFCPKVDISILRDSAKKMERFLTQDELYIVSNAVDGVSVDDISYKFSNDRAYVVSLLNELMTNMVVKDYGGVIRVHNKTIQSEVDVLRIKVAQLEEENEALRYKVQMYDRINKLRELLDEARKPNDFKGLKEIIIKKAAF